MRTSHDTKTGPATLPALLRSLDVDREPLSHQVRAVKTWLIQNKPSPELMISLLANGFGLLAKAVRPTADNATRPSRIGLRRSA